MSCYYPLKAFRTPNGVVFSELRREDILGDIEIPCGRCIGCRMRRASDWTLRCMHESSMHASNCFVTLTYGRDCLPPDGSLEHRDFQLFMKRLRRYFGKSVRFYMCGEYGPLNKRPHYHSCLFGVNFDDRVVSGKSASGAVYYDSPILSKLWSHGIVSVQDLTRETAGYCARYIMKKALGDNAEFAYSVTDADTGEIRLLKPEYSAMSLKPGIGANWFYRYGTDVFPHDYVISDGVEHQVPKYYDKLFKRIRSIERDTVIDDIEFSRVLKAREVVADNTDARRVVRDKVHKARMIRFERNL